MDPDDAFSPCGRRWAAPGRGVGMTFRYDLTTPLPPYGHLLPQGEKDITTKIAPIGNFNRLPCLFIMAFAFDLAYDAFSTGAS